MISVSDIVASRFQPRRMFDSDELYALSKSIKEYGLIQPVTVRQAGHGFYELIAGERRFRACKLAGITQIPAYITSATDSKSAVMALIENVQRQDLHFFEEAEAIDRLIKEHDLTQEQVSDALGKSQSTIANKLRLLKLNDEISSFIISNGLTERHARALLRLEEERLQRIVVETITKKGLNVKRTEQLIDKLLHTGEEKEKRPCGKFILSNRVCINSVKAVYASIREKGVDADFNVAEDDNKVIISIVINKRH
ncbi:MAG: ParB/RepB/Spo0J family partition protein [Clostridia bacterium]|nr:ParB/RepB/Spo0J family partition protein [Clostridia bacterium]